MGSNGQPHYSLGLVIMPVDKLTLISGTLFLAADIFAVASLTMPDWIVSEVGGDTRLGLLQSCVTLQRRPRLCFSPSLPGVWLVSLLCVFLGCISVTTTLILLIISVFQRSASLYAKWLGFVAVIFFCLAAVIFPIGFSQNEIGGAAYQLPNSYQVGISYIMFVMALWTTVISELFASKICLPHF